MSPSQVSRCPEYTACSSEQKCLMQAPGVPVGGNQTRDRKTNINYTHTHSHARTYIQVHMCVDMLLSRPDSVLCFWALVLMQWPCRRSRPETWPRSSARLLSLLHLAVSSVLVFSRPSPSAWRELRLLLRMWKRQLPKENLSVLGAVRSFQGDLLGKGQFLGLPKR